MRKLIYSSLTLGLLPAAIYAASMPATAQTTPAPTVTARSWTVLDYNSGHVLASEGADLRIIPASLTKVMTAYLTFEALHDKRLQWDQMVSVSLNAYHVDHSSSKMFIDPKVPVSIKDLAYGLIIDSGNDAAVQLAEAVGGTEDTFAGMMNKKAAELGMKGSHFVNASGLPNPEHYSTAGDLAILSARLIHDFPEEYKIFSIKEFTYNNIKQGNRNLLLYRDPTVDGMKTGFVHGSGYNMIASAKRNGDQRIVTVVAGAENPRSRAEESMKLLAWAFTNFESVKVASKGQHLVTPTIWKGERNTFSAGIDTDLYQTLQKGMAGKVHVEGTVQGKLIAPIAKGAKVGTVRITCDGKVLAELPLVALEEVKEAGFFARMWDAMRMHFA